MTPTAGTKKTTTLAPHGARVVRSAVDKVVHRVDARAGLHKKQLRTIAAMFLRPNMRILAGGSGFGGKSHVQRRCHLAFATRLARLGIYGVPTLMSSRDNPSLQDRMIGKLADEFGELGEIHTKHKKYGHCWTWHAKEMGPILLRNLTSGRGMEGRKGLEVGMATLDEVTENMRDSYGALCYTVRHPLSPWHPVVGGTNPDGIGHAWSKALWRPHLHRPGTGHGWEDEDSPRWRAFDRMVDPSGELNPLDYVYVPYLPDDNPLFDEATFWMSIADKPAHIQRARRYGLWDAPENARFSYLDPERTLFDPLKKWHGGVPGAGWRMVCVDWGYRNPFAALWVYRDNDNDYWVYRELYRSLVPTDAQIHLIREATGAHETVNRFAGDPAMWAHSKDHTGREEPSAADIYRKAIVGDDRFRCGFVEGSRGSKIVKFATLDKLLGYDNDYPNLKISMDAVALWGELTSAVFASGTELQNLSEELDAKASDHAIDALVYGFHGWLPLVPVEKKEGTPEQVARAVTNERRERAERQFYRRHKRR